MAIVITIAIVPKRKKWTFDSPFHRQRGAETDRVPPVRLSRVTNQREEKDRQRSRPYVLHMRRLRESIREEGVEDPGGDSSPETRGDFEREQVRAEAAQRVAEEDGGVVGGQRTGAERAQRKENGRDAVEVLAERQRVLCGIKDVRLKQLRRLMKRGMPVPVENPGSDVRIARKRRRRD